ncbi:MAG: hypothetical protein IPP07_14065 [Holophagales bacterium]|nr:hypothetical protein [Holophagales bacterium]
MANARRPASRRAAKAQHLRLETAELLVIARARPGPRVEPFVPEPLQEEALLGLAAERFLGVDGLAPGVRPSSAPTSSSSASSAGILETGTGT